MAKAEISVLQILRDTVKRLIETPHYQWGHMGSCNCGFLAQAVTGKSASEIHSAAMDGFGDWSEQLNDYCQATGRGMNGLIDELLAAGFDREDLAHLERLSDPVIIGLLRKPLRYNCKEDVIAYLNTWASHLEDLWLAAQPDLILAVGEEVVEREGSLSLRSAD